MNVLTARLAEHLDEHTVQSWNPRYLAYVVYLGSKGVDEQRANDRERWPGGAMTGFTLWTANRWRCWHRERDVPCGASLSDADHEDFDTWLAEGLPETWHRSAPIAFRAMCGADRPNLRTTEVRGHVTCCACIALLDREAVADAG